MIRLSSSVKLTWSFASGVPLGGCGSLPRGFLPAEPWASRSAILRSYSSRSSSARASARTSTSARAAASVAVPHRRVLARVGQHLRAVDGHRDPADFEHAAARRQLDDLRETLREQLPVAPPKLANRVVIGMGVTAQVSHWHMVVAVALDLAAGKRPGRVAVDEQ